ncbi:MAG: hypothetical protein ACYC0X_15460 [Pirellulaceae bacterium]
MSDSKTRDDILYAFSIEPKHDRETLERYLRKHPELAEDLIDLSHELTIAVALKGKDVGPLPDPKAEDAWQALLKCGPSTSPAVDQNTAFANLKGAALVELAATLDIPRSLLTALRDRLVEPSTIPMRFLSRLANASGSAIKGIQQYLALPPGTADGLQFKADSRPANQGQVPFRKLVDDTPMTDEQREALLRDWGGNGQE